MLITSPELKKEQWSVYVLDQSVAERKFSGNGTITSVLNDDEPVPIVGKVKKKFRREMLEIELQFVKVLYARILITIGSHFACEETADIITRTAIAVGLATSFT